jgi:hypothetical protein
MLLQAQHQVLVFPSMTRLVATLRELDQDRNPQGGGTPRLGPEAV